MISKEYISNYKISYCTAQQDMEKTYCKKQENKSGVVYLSDVNFNQLIERFIMAFTANGRSDHVTMFSPCLPLTVS